MPNELIYYYKKSRMLGFALVSFAFAACSLLLIFDSEITSRKDLLAAPVGIFAIMLGALFIKYSRDSRQQVVVTLTLGSILFVVLIIILFGEVGVGVLGLIFFGFGGLLLIYKAFLAPKPVLKLSKVGLEIDAGLLVGRVFLEWQEITSLNPVTMPLLGGNKPSAWLVVYVKNFEAIQQKYPSLKPNFLNKTNALLVGSPLFADIGSLNASKEQIISEVGSFCTQNSITFEAADPFAHDEHTL